MKRRWQVWWRLPGPALLAGVVWRAGPAQCWLAIRETDGRWFAAACLLALPILLAKGWRWQCLVRA